MKSKILKSVRAFLASMVTVFVLSYGTDYLLEGLGLPIHRLNYASRAVIVMIIAYRNIYNVVGGYVAARLAPSRPVAHALAVGTFGFMGALVATVAMRNMGLGPAWYGFTIVALALPTAYAGGKAFVAYRRSRTVEGLATANT